MGIINKDTKCRINVGAKIIQDWSVFVWPECNLPGTKSRDTKNPNMVFEVKWSLCGYVECKPEVFGASSILVKIDDIEII